MEWGEQDTDRVLQGVSRLGWLVVKRFSAVYRPSEVLAAFACLPKQDFDMLRRLTFSMCTEASDFIDIHLPQFIRGSPSGTQHVLDDRAGPPKGKIDWMQTHAKRMQAGGNEAQFVTRSIERTSDTNAARLVLFLLNKYTENATWLEKRAIPELVRVPLKHQADMARKHTAVLRGRNVRAVRTITHQELASLRRSRRSDISAAIQLYDLYVNIVEQANENLLRAMLQQRQMAPENLDDLFEIWVLLVLVERHLDEGWGITEALLIGPETSPKRPKFTLEKDGAVLEIFFQTVPLEMNKASEYKSIFSEYDLDASVRRPDITTKVSHTDGTIQRLIIEVKRTSDKGYILDSVYKTLGYLSDFKTTVGPDNPLALLVVWDGVTRTKTPTIPSTISILTAEDFQKMSLPHL